MISNNKHCHLWMTRFIALCEYFLIPPQHLDNTLHRIAPEHTGLCSVYRFRNTKCWAYRFFLILQHVWLLLSQRGNYRNEGSANSVTVLGLGWIYLSGQVSIGKAKGWKDARRKESKSLTLASHCGLHQTICCYCL